MRYLLLVSHATLAEGVRAALEMLMGTRDNVLVCGLGASDGPEPFRADVARAVEGLTARDELVVLGDIAGGSPLVSALAVLEERGFDGRYVAFGGLNLPMAISALMGMEEGFALDALRDGVLADGSEAVQQL